MPIAPLFILLVFALATYAQEQQKRVAILNTEDNGEPSLEHTDLLYLTDRIREIALKTLPEDKYFVMTTQSVIDMLGSKENARKVCKEAQCIAEIGRKISADYVGQARLGRFGGNFTISMELYHCARGNLIGSFTGNAKDVFGLLDIINDNAPSMFSGLPDAKKTVVAAPAATPAPAPVPMPVHVPAAPVAANPAPAAPAAAPAPAVHVAANPAPATPAPVARAAAPAPVVPVVSSFKDLRDNKTYKVVKIGEQTWLAENLNYNASGSKCYDNNPANCDKYGRLYDWGTARTACLKGWHLPSKAEWKALVASVGGGKFLKAASGWKNNGNGTDAYSFSALPGGSGGSEHFYYVGSDGYWWSSSDTGDLADRWYMSSKNDNASYGNSVKNLLLSVRCVQD
ncbi:MAG: fibrobacter succinogenes major paralogous domain-containing protein [Fibromonadales bacterium]|nr:fibrobacter succinogenes major paralogous domain-containing protein [Fibromonadales bacterium]